MRRIKIIGIIAAAALLIQGGFISYSMIGGSIFEDSSEKVSNKIADSRNQINGDGKSEENKKSTVKANDKLQDDFSLEISNEILDIIKSSDPEKYTRNVEKYKNLLKELNVHISFKNEIERLINKKYKLPDILTAYSFLNDNYGKIEDIEVLVKEKVSGKQWSQIFKNYLKNNPEFVPSNFDSQYLDKLLQTPGISDDVIMITDRVSQKAKTDFSEIFDKKINGLSWRLINAQYGIVNGLEKSPHLSVTREQLDKYANKYKLSEKQVIEAMALANKLELSDDDVLEAVKNGLSKEDIYSKAYHEKYY